MQLTNTYIGFVVGLVLIAIASGRSISNTFDSKHKWQFWPSDFDTMVSGQVTSESPVTETTVNSTTAPVKGLPKAKNGHIDSGETTTVRPTIKVITQTEPMVDHIVKKTVSNSMNVHQKESKVVIGIPSTRAAIDEKTTQMKVQSTTAKQNNLPKVASVNDGSISKPGQRKQSNKVNYEALQFIAHLIEKYSIPINDVLANHKEAHANTNSLNDNKNNGNAFSAKNFKPDSLFAHGGLRQTIQNTLNMKPDSMFLTNGKSVAPETGLKQASTSRTQQSSKKPQPSNRPDSLASVVKQKAQENRIQVPTFQTQAWNMGDNTNEIKYVEPSQYKTYLMAQPNPKTVGQYSLSNGLTNFRPYASIQSAGNVQSYVSNSATPMLADVDPIDIL